MLQLCSRTVVMKVTAGQTRGPAKPLYGQLDLDDGR